MPQIITLLTDRRSAKIERKKEQPSKLATISPPPIFFSKYIHTNFLKLNLSSIFLVFLMDMDIHHIFEILICPSIGLALNIWSLKVSDFKAYMLECEIVMRYLTKNVISSFETLCITSQSSFCMTNLCKHTLMLCCIWEYVSCSEETIFLFLFPRIENMNGSWRLVMTEQKKGLSSPFSFSLTVRIYIYRSTTWLDLKYTLNQG